MELEYTKVGDYLLPNLKPNEEKEKTYGKWGQLRGQYLKSNFEGKYNLLKMSGDLIPYPIDKGADTLF